MKYTEKRFSVAAPISDAYRDNWEATFGKKRPEAEPRGQCPECSALWGVTEGSWVLLSSHGCAYCASPRVVALDPI